MKCCVPKCKTDSKLLKTKKIKLHVFPTKTSLRAAWIKALGDGELDPNVRSAVCSKHFRINDLVIAKGAVKKLKNGAVPLIVMDIAENNNEQPTEPKQAMDIVENNNIIPAEPKQAMDTEVIVIEDPDELQDPEVIVIEDTDEPQDTAAIVKGEPAEPKDTAAIVKGEPAEPKVTVKEELAEAKPVVKSVKDDIKPALRLLQQILERKHQQQELLQQQLQQYQQEQQQQQQIQQQQIQQQQQQQQQIQQQQQQSLTRAQEELERTRIEKDDLPFICEHCEKRFSLLAVMASHMWLHVNEKKFKCDRCPKTFRTKIENERHMKTHGPLRPKYNCTYCGKLFLYPTDLTIHTFHHTGILPYKCDHCLKQFLTNRKLKEHEDEEHAELLKFKTEI